MKKTLLAVLSAVVLVAVAAPTFAVPVSFGDTAQAGVGATIESALAIAKVTDLEFGVIVPSEKSDTVSVSTEGGRTAGNGVKLLATNPAATNALFAVTGAPNATYEIILPADDTVTVQRVDGDESMAVNKFVCDQEKGLLNEKGAQDLKVGATLTVGENQMIGRYVGKFLVSVNY